MARKIVVTSGKGGVGKTTVCANLGIALSKKGFRVALIDLDFGLNNLDVTLGMENDAIFDLYDVFQGRCRPRQALLKNEKYPNLYLLPSDSIRTYSSISGQNVKLIIDSIEHSFDYIFIDCPAGIDSGFHRAVSAVSEAFVVTTPSLSSLKDADKVINILNSYKLKFVGLIVNRARGDLMLGNKMMTPEEICFSLKTELIGVIPEEDYVFLNASSLPKNSESFKAFSLLAGNIISNKKKFYDVTKKYSGFWGSIRKGLKKTL